MEACEVNINKDRWKYFFRQLLIASGAWNCYFMLGLCMGAPTVFIPQIRKEANSTEAVSEDMASWIPAILSYGGVPWILILPYLISVFGRKIPHIIVSVATFAGFTTFVFSTTVTHIIISEMLQGLVAASYLTISVVIIIEYASPKYRGMFLTLKSACFFWGILFANTIGTFFHWKKIGMVGLGCSVYNLVSVFFWPESPYWLAGKGQIDECTKAHVWLKGRDEISDKELKSLINSCRHDRNTQPQNLYRRIRLTVKEMLRKQFYKPVLFSVLLTSLYLLSGKLICTVYAIDIIKKMTNSESTAYTAMLILDAVTLISMYGGCLVVKVVKRRVMLLTTSSIGVFFLFSISLYLYLVKLSIVCEYKYLSVSLLTGFSIAIGCGPMILSTSISGELLPLESRSMSMCVIAFVFKISYGSFLKVAPYLFKTFGLHGTFLSFALSSSVCLILIYLYLPETKDKNLQEIADCMKGVDPMVEREEELAPVRRNTE
ncbi:hypothetical protein O3G_MSEX012832 [Manduca sexta]|uniref:Major facilitator superfamily (MFS) profile domain-containing protein n=1 Tax=Manduca sexta TaxID=7130 RepID=A0A922CW59_MANSE|nr:hypothetical protein O3G_MSEX012832 [Manduca sexta]